MIPKLPKRVGAALALLLASGCRSHPAPPAGFAPTRATLPNAPDSLIRETATRLFPSVSKPWRGAPVYLWVVVGGQDSVLRSGSTPRAPDIKTVSTMAAYRMVPGMDSSRIAHIDVLQYGTLAPESPPVVWIHVRK